MRTALITAVFLSLAGLSAADECPTKLPDTDGHILMGWKPDHTITYSFDGSMDNSSARAASNMAFKTWSDANVNNRTNVQFQQVDRRDADIVVVNSQIKGTINDEIWAAGYYRPYEYEDNRPTKANIYLYVDIFDPMSPGYFSAMYKVMLHEIGHSMGLGHPDTPAYHGSIMNGIGGQNDQYDWMPDGLTNCDKTLAGTYNGFISAGGPQPPKHPKPPRMPKDDTICKECRTPISVYDDSGAVHIVIVDGFCCGSNGDNIYPRRPDLMPMFAFLQTGYTCASDGWIQFTCAADMCCVHPDDVPPGAFDRPMGTTCAEQGWWEADQLTQCNAIWGEPCIKKEVCGVGQCQPWPNYCWKEPRTAPHTPDPDPEPEVGIQCSSKGWYNGDQEDQCIAGNGSCIRKQDCDGQQCLPAPYYCWKPS